MKRDQRPAVRNAGKTLSIVIFALNTQVGFAQPVVSPAGWDKLAKATCSAAVEAASELDQVNSSNVFEVKSEIDSGLEDEDTKVDYDPNLNSDQMELQHRYFQVVKQSLDTSMSRMIDLVAAGQRPSYVALAGQECKGEMQSLRSQYVR